MKKFYALAIAAVAAAGGFWLTQDNETVAEYSPREEAFNVNTSAGAVLPQELFVKLFGDNETGKYDPSLRVKALADIEKRFGKVGAQKNANLDWNEMGPDNVGGRTRGIAFVDEQTVFIGSVSGGLYKSTNGGNNWSKVVSCPAQMISDLAITGSGDIFVSTGSTFEGGFGGTGDSGFPGTGLFRSTDGGSTWTVVEGTEPTNFAGGNWNVITAIEEDRSNPNRLWIGNTGGLGYFDTNSNTLYHPANGDDELPGLDNNGNCEVIESSSDGSLMYTAIGDELFRSTDFGSSWQIVADDTGNGEPNDDVEINVSGRMSVAISPDNKDYAYVLKATSGGSLRDAYYTNDGGVTWNDMWPDADNYDLFGGNGQGWYDNCVTVIPGQENLALFGGVTLWRAGEIDQPEQIAVNFELVGVPELENLYVHSDLHTFEWSPNGVLFIGGDGGIFRSYDSGQTFVPSNKGYNVTQFYGIDFTPTNGFIGGSQDNGTTFVPNDGSLLSDLSGIQIFGGDGFDCEVSQVTSGDLTGVVVTSQNGNLARTDGVSQPSSFFDDELQALADANNGDIGSFYTTFYLYEDTEDFDSQRSVLFVNPWGQDSTITEPLTVSLTTENLDLPFEHTFPAGTEFRYWDELERPEQIVAEQSDYVNPYFWLDDQTFSQITFCDTVGQDSVGFEIDLIITPIDTCDFVGDSLVCITYDYDTTEVFTTVFDPILDCADSLVYAADVSFNQPERIKITDPYSTIFAFGLSGTQGLWITREVFDFNTTPDWWRLEDNVAGQTKEIEISPDGNQLWYSNWGGRLVRFNNLDEIWSAEEAADATGQIIITNGPVIAGMHIDPNNPDHMVLAMSGYNAGSGVRESWNATSDSPTFTEIWNPEGELQNIPVLDVLIEGVNSTDGSRIMAATEFGVFVTENGGDTWEECNGGAMERVPTFDIRQQTIGIEDYMNPTNTGMIYLGTHGRGTFNNDEYFITNVAEQFEDKDFEGFSLYPNPAQENATLEFDLAGNSEVYVQVYSINGRLVKEIPSLNLSTGVQQLQLSTDDLSNGNYVVAIVTDSKVFTQKLVVYK